MYKPSSIIVVQSNLTPTFAEIVDILLVGDANTCIFLCKEIINQCFNEHYHSYEVLKSDNWMAVKQTDLVDHHILSLYHIDTADIYYIPLKYHIMEDL